MKINQPSGFTDEELFERAVAALTREWGVSDREAREAIMRVRREAERRRVASKLGWARKRAS